MTPKITGQILVADAGAIDQLIKQLGEELRPRFQRTAGIIIVTPRQVLPAPASTPIYDIGDLPDNTKLMLNVQEAGGQSGSKGFAMVVCKTDGNPCPPVFVPNKNVRANGQHAFFTAQEPLVLVKTNFNGVAFSIQLEEYSVNVSPPICWINPQPIFRADALSWLCPHCGAQCSPLAAKEHRNPKGTTCESDARPVFKLPGTFEQFRRAIEAAVAKASCPNCRHVHFAAAGKESAGMQPAQA